MSIEHEQYMATEKLKREKKNNIIRNMLARILSILLTTDAKHLHCHFTTCFLTKKSF